MDRNLKIGNRIIGINQPTYIIAEAGVNHNGQLDIALELIDKAKEIGADCIKFQTFKAENVITKDAPKANYQLEVTDKNESQFEMLKKLELDFNAYQTIISHCKKKGIDFLSTPYNKEDADFLNDLGVDAFKIASGQLVEPSFLKYVAGFGKPIILSTGMGTLAEVYNAVQTIRKEGNEQLVVLQCTTNYPAKNKDANIRAMETMGNALNVLYGYSDHVPENYACYTSVVLGGCLVEKHFTLDKAMDGPDHSSSLESNEFATLIKGIRAVEDALGCAIKQPSHDEKMNVEGMRRSIVLLRDLSKGDAVQEEDIAFKRPAIGIRPDELNRIIGKKVKWNISAESILQYNMIEW